MRTLTVALLVAATLARPAVAAPAHRDTLAGPQVAGVWAGTAFSGFSCGLATSNDPSGVLDTDPDIMHGVLTAGPVTVYDVGVVTTVECLIQLNNATPRAVPAAVDITTPGSGPVAVGINQVAYVNHHVPGPPFNDIVYVCTRVGWAPGGPPALWLDMDLSVAGTQCMVAASV